MRLFRAALLFFFVGFCAAPADAQTVSPASVSNARDLSIPRITSRPRLEEFLDGKSRLDMLHVETFRQRQPGDGEPATRKTSAFIGYDDKNFYAAFVCEAPHNEIRARMGRREDINNDDKVGVFLDTYHDHQRAYEFLVNPLGIQADAVQTDGQNDDFSFDTLWNSEGRITPDGYAVLIAIPFKSLRFASADVQTWGFALGRFIPSNNESSFWPFLTNRVNGFSAQLGNLTGLESISPGRNIQLIPYGALGHAHFLDNPVNGGPLFRTNTDIRAGLDFKLILHDSLSLDVALKPDFSQVETDDPQVTVNQRYEVRFDEKRPFFIENNGFFATPETLFFSRRVIDPTYGTRLTGKLGRWDLGFLGINDRAASIAVGSADSHFGQSAVIGVARVQREFGTQSSAGFLITDRAFAGGWNRVASLDTKLRLNQNWTFNGQGIISQTKQTNGAISGGDAWNLNLHAQHRDYVYDLTYTDRAEGFRAELGFIPRVNIRQAQLFALRRFHPQNKYVVSWGPRIFVNADYDHSGVQQDWQMSPGLQMEMPRSTFFNVNYSNYFERFSSTNFLHWNTGLGFHSEYFKAAVVDLNYSQGTRINYASPAGVNPFLGNGKEFRTTLTLRPASRLKLDEIYYYTELATPAGTTAFVNHLLRSRFNYQFNKQLSLRLIADYNATLENASLVSFERQKRLSGDALIIWLLHPGTAVYVGYTDSLENLALNPGSPPSLNRIAFLSTTTQRQFFAKMSYLLRF